ncbi:hypothetical protein KW786_01980 [Candidatus Parcubacteria bacterium]|nr:hypothetical protein [Candidatus Parcubacteria bacterium]
MAKKKNPARKIVTAKKIIKPVQKLKKVLAVPKKIKKAKKPEVKSIQLYSEGPKSFFKAKIKVIGIGGGGSSIVSEIGRSLHKATFLTADTDLRASRKKGPIKRILFGQNLTHGLGTGANPELGRQAAEKKKKKIATFQV